MFGWLGDFGKVSKKKSAAKKRGSKRVPRTPKAHARKYPRVRAMRFPFGPAYAPTNYEGEEEGGFFSPMGPAMGPMGPAAPSTVTIGKPGPNTREVCGCRITRMKNGKQAIKCEGAGPKGGPMFRFANDAQLARAQGADSICTFLPTLGARRGPRKANPFAFQTSRGKLVSFKRKPSWRAMKKNVALYYHMLGKRAQARGRKLRYMPAFADIGWGW